MRGGIEDFDGLPVVSLLDTPLGGWNDVVKRSVDMVLATILSALLSPVFLLIAIAIKLTSSGPVFYRQERMSLDGRTFLSTAVEGYQLVEILWEGRPAWKWTWVDPGFQAVHLGA